MKKLLFILVVLSVSSASFSQLRIGGGLTFGSDMSVHTDWGVGLNLRGDFQIINDNWHLAPGITYVFPSSDYGYKYNAFQMNGDLHYFLPVDSRDFNLYALGGLNFTHEKVKHEHYGYDDSDNNLGLNLGMGFDYKNFVGELKYDSAFGQLALTFDYLF